MQACSNAPSAECKVTKMRGAAGLRNCGRQQHFYSRSCRIQAARWTVCLLQFLHMGFWTMVTLQVRHSFISPSAVCETLLGSTRFWQMESCNLPRETAHACNLRNSQTHAHASKDCEIMNCSRSISWQAPRARNSGTHHLD